MQNEVIFVDQNVPFVDKILSKYCDVFQFTGKELSKEDLLEKKCTVLFTRSTVKINSQLLEDTKVKFVATATSGTDHADIDYLNSKNIHFASALGSNANSVAEYVIRNILLWSLNNKIDIKNKTIGIIGFGNIGKIVARYSELLGLNVVINDPPLKEKKNEFLHKYIKIDDLLESADIITNHVPLNYLGDYPTYNLLDYDHLNMVQNKILFIHTSRGRVVNEQELLKISKEKELALIVDVWENEPDFNSNLFKSALFATPHIAGHAYDSKLRGSKMVLESFSKFMNINIDTSEIDNLLEEKKQLSYDIFRDYEYLFDTIEKNRLLSEDYARMNELIDLNTQKKQKQFYELRKNYPIRREFLI